MGSVRGKTLPSARRGRQAFEGLERWLYSRKSGLMAFHEVEIEEERRGREVLRLLLQAHIDLRGEGDMGKALEVIDAETGEMRRYTHKRMHTRHLASLFGTVSVTRVAYCLPGRQSVHPLDARLQLPARSLSYELQRRLVKAAVKGPFDEALETLEEATGVRVSKRTAEQRVLDASCDFEIFYDKREGAWRTKGGPILVASVDGKGIPMVKPKRAHRKARLGRGEKLHKKRMSTVAAVFTQEPYVRTPAAVVKSLFSETPSKRKRRPSRPLNKRVWASLLADKTTFIANVKDEMLRRDPHHCKTWVVVTDGERALQKRVSKTLQDNHFTLVLDLLHVLEKLWMASHVFHAEGSSQAQRFVEERILRILMGAVSQVVKGLRQMVTKRRLRGAKRKTVLGVAGYYYRNRSRMRYHLYLKQGLPIASGSVEGACKNLVKDRMERSGMRWTEEGAEAMLRLRATYLSGDFEEYWDFHVRQEQVRLYPWAYQNPVVEK